MFSKRWWVATGERVVVTFLEGVGGVFLVGEGFNAFDADWGHALGIGAGAAFLALVKCAAATRVGDNPGPSLVSAETVTGRHRA